jgi:hypothetical protein
VKLLPKQSEKENFLSKILETLAKFDHTPKKKKEFARFGLVPSVKSGKFCQIFFCFESFPIT